MPSSALGHSHNVLGAPLTLPRIILRRVCVDTSIFLRFSRLPSYSKTYQPLPSTPIPPTFNFDFPSRLIFAIPSAASSNVCPKALHFKMLSSRVSRTVSTASLASNCHRANGRKAPPSRHFHSPPVSCRQIASWLVICERIRRWR